MNSSTTPHPSALVFFSTSLLLAAAGSVGAGDVPLRATQVAALELELSLARRPDVYLVLNPTARQLEVKVRGVALDRIPLRGVEKILHVPFLSASSPPPFPLPAVWRVVDGPGDSDREYIAPTELRPYRAEGYDDPPPAATPTRPGAPPPTATPFPEPPASYRAQLDCGWDLWITETLPPLGFFARARAAVRDGWERLRGRGTHPRPAITLAMDREDAKRLHHLMRSGMPLLVLADP